MKHKIGSHVMENDNEPIIMQALLRNFWGKPKTRMSELQNIYAKAPLLPHSKSSSTISTFLNETPGVCTGHLSRKKVGKC